MTRRISAVAVCCSSASAQRSDRGARPRRSAASALAQRSVLRLKLRDPRVRIVRHHVHPGHPALLRDGARIARVIQRGRCYLHRIASLIALAPSPHGFCRCLLSYHRSSRFAPRGRRRAPSWPISFPPPICKPSHATFEPPSLSQAPWGRGWVRQRGLGERLRAGRTTGAGSHGRPRQASGGSEKPAAAAATAEPAEAAKPAEAAEARRGCPPSPRACRRCPGQAGRQDAHHGDVAGDPDPQPLMTAEGGNVVSGTKLALRGLLFTDDKGAFEGEARRAGAEHPERRHLGRRQDRLPTSCARA